MRKLILAGALAIATSFAAAAPAVEYGTAESVTAETMVTEVGPPCQIPVTKVYRINPGFCPRVLVGMIPAAVGPGCCGCDCGPYGIPPIYASGQNVLVRQTPEMQDRVAEFLTELGALVPKKVN